MPSDRERAKAIVVELIRESGGTFQNRTNLFKAFWKSHVEYAKKHVAPLSEWPIVRMTHGPGIDRFHLILGELMAEGMVQEEQVEFGDKTGFRFVLTGVPSEDFSSDEREAIRSGVSFVARKSAKQVRDESHLESRAWQSAKDGERIDVFLDAIPESGYDDRTQRIRRILSKVKATVPDSPHGGI
jgi:hypothetical protein